MIVVGIDPGETCGYAVYRVEPEVPERTLLLEMGQFKDDETASVISRFNDKFGVDIYVLEDYRVYAHKASRHAGDRLITARVLGMFEMSAQTNKQETVYQPASILPIAQKWTQMPIPKNHSISHQFSALNHAMFYLIKKEWALSALAMKGKK